MSGLHVVILAAGRGSRLGVLPADRPKWLLDVRGRPIADRQLGAVTALGDRAASLSVVTGHAAAAVEDYLDAGAAELVHNPRYADLNNWYSVLLALRSIDDPGAAVAVVNSDLFASSEWILAFLETAARSEEDALIAVDLERTLTDESMKVSAADGHLATIGKVGIDDPVGEYVGLLMARGAALEDFRRSLESFEEAPQHVDEWYERAVGLTAAAGTPWTIWPTPGSDWVEIDDDSDHAAAESLAGAEA